MEKLYNTISEILKKEGNFSIDSFLGENTCFSFNIKDRWFVISWCNIDSIFGFQENLEGFDSDFNHLGIMLYKTKQPARIISRIKDIIKNPNLPIKGSKLV